MIKTEVELEHFRTPNYVIQATPSADSQPIMPGSAGTEPPKYHVKDLSPETLSELCDQFRRDIFAKAEKGDPCNGRT